MNKNDNLVKATTITLPVALVDLVLKAYGTDNRSEAINSCLLDFLTVSSFGERMDDFTLHQILSIEERNVTRTCSVRIPKVLKKIIQKKYQGENSFSDTVTIMLSNMLYLSGKVPALPYSPGNNFLPLAKRTADTSMHLLRIPGSKWNQAMQAAIRHIFETSNKVWATSIEPCVGALGIFANFRVAFNEIINDKDLRKVNLYKALKKNANGLLLEMLCLATPFLKIFSEYENEEVFEKLKEDEKSRNGSSSLNGCGIDVSATARFLYLNLMSVWNDGSAFKCSNSYRKTLTAIRPLHERLEKTVICGMDILALVRKHKKDRNTIFIIDPPYLDTDIYADKLVTDNPTGKTVFGDNEHKELAKLLRETCHMYGNDFIYFCRITSTRRKDSHGKPTISVEELAENDRHLLGRIDDMFWGYGFYYMDVLFNEKDGTIERIITSFPFEGAKLYGKGGSDYVYPL